jgi:hypothetical protein
MARVLKCLGLELEVVVIVHATVGWGGHFCLSLRHVVVGHVAVRVMALAAMMAAMGTFRFVDLQVNASFVLSANNSEQSADSLGSLTHTADDLAHISRVDEKSN